MNPLSALYASVASARRQWYAARPEARRRLPRPVVSVGNLVVGGSGKTPVVAAIARLLVAMGERPAILSRGYARQRSTRRVVVVSDGARVLETVQVSGDEPQLLARAVAGVPVLVSADRYASGMEAVARFDASVLVLDDGFQHVTLSRDVDVLLVTREDLEARVLPVGRLREPLSAAKVADALVVTGDEADASHLRRRLGVARSFLATRQYGAMRLVASGGEADSAGAGRRIDQPRSTVEGPHPPARVVAVAGIARPWRFFSALRELGWEVVEEVVFRDHHWFTSGDLRRVEAVAARARVSWILTTEKDAMRLETRTREAVVPWAYLPMTMSVEPAGELESWLRARLGQGSDSRPTTPLRLG